MRQRIVDLEVSVMVDLFRGRFIFPALALTALSFCTTAARAADMPLAPPIDVVEEERVTFGTGWYLRGDVAAANDPILAVGNASLSSRNNVFNAYSVGIGFGYKYNDWFRSDVTLDYRSPRSFAGNTQSLVPCQFGAAPVLANGAIVGSTPIYGGCSDFTRASLKSLHVLFNGYVDLGTWYGVTPYIGAGVGFNSVRQNYAQNWYYNNQNPYNPTWTDPFNGATYTAYWDQSRSSNSLQFAWAAMAGVSYALNRHLALDVGYRFLGLGNTKSLTAFSGTTTKYVKAQELRVGLRFTPD